MDQSRNAYRESLKETKWEDNIKMDLRVVDCHPREWIDPAVDRDQLRAYIRARMNLRFPHKPFS